MSTEELDLSAFKAYDIRGRVPDQLNTDLAEKIGRAYAQVIGAKSVVVGHDIRLTGPELTDAVVRGLTESGVDVKLLGQCGTEEVYFATSHLKLDGGIMITASHNPEDYNGLKLVREGARPISADTGLQDIAAAIRKGDFKKAETPGTQTSVDVRTAYIEQLLSYVDTDKLKPLKLVVNAGNGSAGPTIDALAPHLPFEFIRLQHDPDGHFPNGVPNPLLPDNRAVTADAVKEHGADFGVAWDGDFDRCFLFDEQGTFIEGYYIVGLLATQMLKSHPGAKIIYDPRLTWNTEDLVEAAGGQPVMSVSGHAFIKQRLRDEDAVYGGEMSAHHYFRDFTYCDSGMIPWLLIAAEVSQHGALSQLVGERMKKFPASGEINRRVDDAQAVLEKVKAHYVEAGGKLDETDGVSVDFDQWRFNLRKSNTEPLIRLNVESRGDAALMQQKTEELLGHIGGTA